MYDSGDNRDALWFEEMMWDEFLDVDEDGSLTMTNFFEEGEEYEYEL